MEYQEYLDTPVNQTNSETYYTISQPYGIGERVRSSLKEKMQSRQAWRQLRPFIENEGIEWTRKPNDVLKTDLAHRRYDDLRIAELVSEFLYPQGTIRNNYASPVPLYIPQEKVPRRVKTAPATITSHTNVYTGPELNTNEP